jgi:hypothetical protein
MLHPLPPGYVLLEVRKLLIILNAIARNGAPWQPERTLART